MRCPFCSKTGTKVIDSRESGRTIRRRRKCTSKDCKKRFTTYERIETPHIDVMKKDGRREPFSREKIKTGLFKACEKRPIGHDKIDAIIDNIEAKILNKNVNEVTSRFIGNNIMDNLKELDRVAYIRFASVYRSFADVSSFEKEVKKIKIENKNKNKGVRL